ncbi:hypothetical protein K435DRAFT_869413 [Dendrothele bispora CBS 962.96]|uniref:Uncharacterized protein n=1 Tax=Dendrothele bispora (strain CBS 962.96) TaxID=1314807 RepID=A0A4S8L994_DENBC|nr:hypothetical protein K435DRAFT_869413 [Dendrothele bispora CBS 962.96]
MSDEIGKKAQETRPAAFNSHGPLDLLRPSSAGCDWHGLSISAFFTFTIHLARRSLIFPSPSCINLHSLLSYASNSSGTMGVIFVSRIPDVGTSIDLDTDSIHLNDAAVEGSTLASVLIVQPTAPSSTRINNTGATPTQPQSTLADATSFTTEPTNAPTSTASSPPGVPSTSSSSVSQADVTCTLPISSSVLSISTANNLAANNVVAQTTTPVRTQPRHPALLLDPLPAKHLLHLVLRLQSVIVPPFHNIIYSNDGNSRNTGACFHYLRRQCDHHH